MKVSLFGNPDLPFDALPFQILPRLQERFPEITFALEDPNELDLPTEKRMIYIDTVRGLKKSRIITADEVARTQTRATAHDFDLTTHILLVKKVLPAVEIIVIGIPMHYEQAHACAEVTEIIKKLIS